jgi:hypothetical protein
MESYEHELATLAHTAKCDAIRAVEAEMRRPFVVLRPKIFPDGNQWCALYGDNLQEGVCGFGDTPELAAQAFDNAWLHENIRPEARRYSLSDAIGGCPKFPSVVATAP